MKIRSIVFAAAIALPLATTPVGRATGPMGGESMGNQPPSQRQQQPSEGDIWGNVDQTMKNVHEKQAREAEAERIERGQLPPSDSGPRSHGEREADREHFVGKNVEAEAKLSKVVHKRQELVNDMLKMYSKHPSPGLAESIKRNNAKLSVERAELDRTRGFIQRNR